MNPEMQRHGGNHHQLEQMLPGGNVHDFSVNTHPFGPPEAALSAAREALSRTAEYPEPESKKLGAALAMTHGLPSNALVCGNGATELIDLIPRALMVNSAVIAVPTYSEYGHAVRRAGGSVLEVGRRVLNRFPLAAVLAVIKEQKPELAVVCSPNNPTGERLPDDDFESLLTVCEISGTRLLLDEAFVEYDRHESRIGKVLDHPALMVLRGFTKFYALAGLRVGYLAAHPHVAEAIAAARPPWSVNRPAAAAAVACLGAGREYIHRERERVCELRAAFASGLARLGLTPLPSSANYLLCRLPDGDSADRLYEELALEGILIRHCASFGLSDNYIRLRVHRPEQNQKLLARLAAHLKRSGRKQAAAT